MIHFPSKGELMKRQEVGYYIKFPDGRNRFFIGYARYEGEGYYSGSAHDHFNIKEGEYYIAKILPKDPTLPHREHTQVWLLERVDEARSLAVRFQKPRS